MSPQDDIKAEEALEQEIRESQVARPVKSFSPCAECGSKKWHDGRLCRACIARSIGRGREKGK
jgi:hypothetical protein